MNDRRISVAALAAILYPASLPLQPYQRRVLEKLTDPDFDLDRFKAAWVLAMVRRQAPKFRRGG